MNNETVCRLCLELILSDAFEVFDEMKSDMLKFLFLNLDKDISKDPIICSNCAENLQLSYHFRTSCLTNSNYFRSHTYTGNPAVLNPVNINAIKENHGVICEEKTICRFCLNYFEKHLLKDLNTAMEEDVSLRVMFEKCLPEININVERQSMCRNCQEFLQIQFNFIMTCQANEEKIRNFRFPEIHENFSAILNKIKNLKQPNIIGVNVKIELEDIKIEDYVSDNLLEVKKEEGTETVEENDYQIKGEVDNCVNGTQLVIVSSDNVKVEPEDVKIEDYVSLLEVKKEEKTGTVEEYDYQIKGEVNNFVEQLQADDHVEKPQERNEEISDQFQCPYCEYKGCFNSRLVSHMKNIHRIRFFSCHRCSYETNDEDCLKKHQVIHGVNSTFECSECQKVFCSKTSIERHLLTKHNLLDIVTLKIHFCNYCNYKTTHRTHLLNHVNSNHLHVKKKYQCGYCSRTFLQKSHLKPHIASVHLKLRPHICKGCKETFRKKYFLDCHIVSHHSKDEDLMKTVTNTIHHCDHCSFKSTNIARMTEHMETHNKHLRPYICEGCKKIFKEIRTLHHHIISHHPKDEGLMKTVTCKIHKCDKCFVVTNLPKK